MSTALVQVGRTSVRGDKEYNTFDITFGGTYPTGGEPITAASVNLQSVIEEVQLPPVTGGGFYPTRPIFNADGSVNIQCFETVAAAAGLPGLQEKTNAEAYVASTTARVTFIGPS